MTKYKAYIHTLEVVLEIQVKEVDIYSDLMLIIHQVKREWKTTNYKLKPY